MIKPRIYCFSNSVGGGEGTAYAMAEDGTVLGSHFCSNECYVPNDLGVNEGSRPDRHETYLKHYPKGYEMMFIPSSEIGLNKDLQDTFARNAELGKQSSGDE